MLYTAGMNQFKGFMPLLSKSEVSLHNKLRNKYHSVEDMLLIYECYSIAKREICRSHSQELKSLRKDWT